MTTSEEPEFSIITVINSKGGVGKTTFTMLLGSAAHASNVNVVFLDTDPQGSLIQWVNASKKAGQWPDNCEGYHVGTAEDIMALLQKLDSDGFDGMVFVDTVGVADIATLALVNNSDVVAVPVMISPKSRDTTLQALDLIQNHVEKLPEKVRPVIKVVRNAVPKPMIKGHKAIFEEIGTLPICTETYIHRHNLLDVWENEGPLFTRYTTQRSGEQLEKVHAQNTLAALQEGTAVINELMDGKG